MSKELKQKVLEANLELVKQDLVIFTWGNVSGIDRERQVLAIKPSGVAFEDMRVSDIVLVDMEGRQVEGTLKPSSDTATHLEIYKAFPGIGGIVHTHSTYATAWAQAGRSIPVIGTTHADYFAEDIPCTDDLTEAEIETGYEKQTGISITRAFKKINPIHVPAVLVKHHGPFTWGKDPDDAVSNSVVLEQVARMAYLAFAINPSLTMNQAMARKHFSRKHGDGAYYGQNNKS